MEVFINGDYDIDQSKQSQPSKPYDLTASFGLTIKNQNVQWIKIFHLSTIA